MGIRCHKYKNKSSPTIRYLRHSNRIKAWLFNIIRAFLLYLELSFCTFHFICTKISNTDTYDKYESNLIIKIFTRCAFHHIPDIFYHEYQLEK